ncbi:unnamed protein product [Lymnaea stagnalis]|uniref:RING-type domain-containing protein n=1 Tax=Lymnaea stagnalis TaxID=6523 RepID=A0AAV2HP49_LYMST
MSLRKPVRDIGNIKIRFLIIIMIITLLPECVSRQKADDDLSFDDVTLFETYCKNLGMEPLSPKGHRDTTIDQIKGSSLYEVLFLSTNFLIRNKLALQSPPKSEPPILKTFTTLADLSITVHVAALLYCLIYFIRLQFGMEHFIKTVCCMYGKNKSSKLDWPKLDDLNLKAMLKDVIYPEMKKYKHSSVYGRWMRSYEKEKSLQKPERGREYTVMTLFQTDMQRIASYHGNPHLLIPDSVSVLKLANAGFYYPGFGSRVTCTQCSTEVLLDRFYEGDRMNDPSDSRFHAPGCPFSYLDDDQLNSIKPVHFSSNDPEVHSEQTRLSIQIPVKFPTEKFSLGAAQSILCVPHVPDELEIDGVSCSHAVDSRSLSAYLNPGAPEPQPSEDDNLGSTPRRESNISFAADDQRSTLPQTATEASAAASDESHNGATSSHHAAGSSHWLDDDLCVPEQCIIKSNDPGNKLNIYQSTCIKNPGHFAYFLLDKLRPEQLPSAARCKEFIQFIQLFGLLTVRVKVLVQRSDRKGVDTSKDQEFKVGTGWVSLSQQTVNQTSEEGGEHRRLNALRKYVATLVKKEKHLISIETNRHVVASDEEAVNTTVEFFLDYPNSRGVKTLKGVKVIHSDVVGDNQSTLVCKTSDLTFVQQINKIRQDLLEVKEKLPKRTKESMTKKLYIIGHPHGKEKVLSYGDSVPVKYAIRDGGNNGSQLKITRVNNANEVRTSPADIRKSILYAADTCEGSSGAPIIGFTKELSPGTGQNVLQMTVWMHNGADRDHSLGVSVLKECSGDDLQRYMSHDNHQDSGAPDESEDSEDEQSPGKQAVSSPVFKVLSHPSYPAYIAYAKRLESLKGWEFGAIHTAEELADAGFFYAGYSDCIRCFQCGLGLRSWKPGDDVNQEHERHRPSCPFLRALLHRDAASTASPGVYVSLANADNVTAQNTEDHLHAAHFRTTLAVPGNEHEIPRNGSQGKPVYNDSEVRSNSEVLLSSKSLSGAKSQTGGDNLVLDNSPRQDNFESTNSPQDSPLSSEIPTRLLQREHRALAQQLMCKVCNSAPIKELFLPCGDLYACSECSKRMTHCRSCNKLILATVVTYFT